MQTVTLRDTHKPIDEIMGYQHDSLIERYLKDHGGTKEDAANCFEALKQFLVVCSMTPGSKLVSEPIDQMWHTFLLFTKDYKAFCEEYLGRFIHHTPNGGFPKETYANTLALAKELFVRVDEKFWLENADCDPGSGASSGCPEF